MFLHFTSFGPTNCPDKVLYVLAENFDPLEVKIGKLRDALERVALEQQYYNARDVRHRHSKRPFPLTIGSLSPITPVTLLNTIVH